MIGVSGMYYGVTIAMKGTALRVREALLGIDCTIRLYHRAQLKQKKLKNQRVILLVGAVGIEPTTSPV